MVLPWTARNYIVYQRLIPIDTLGQINLWLDLGVVSERNDHIAELRQMPQADRAPYALARAREILAADPLRPLHAIRETFLHIWKAQYVEDFFIKQGFFTRPLRETAALGLFGDLLWFVYTLAGLVGLAGPVREGWHNRLFALAWLGYSLLTVLVFHVEPRYLLPIWTLLALYGAGALAGIRRPNKEQEPGALRANKEQRTPHQASASPVQPSSVLGSRFSVLGSRSRLSRRPGLYRAGLQLPQLPQIIAEGLARERALVAGERAYRQGDYAAAERWFRAALAAQPNFVDAQIDLALALEAQGRHDEARAAVEDGGAAGRPAAQPAGPARWRGGWGALGADAHRGQRRRGDPGLGAGMAALAADPPAAPWRRARHRLYRRLQSARASAGWLFRWLRGAGRVVLPLPEPLSGPDSTVTLRLSGGLPGDTPLELRVGDGPTWRVPVTGGIWRAYRLPIPPALVGQTRIAIELRAPTFIPAFTDPSSDDLRVLSVRVSDVRVEE